MCPFEHPIFLIILKQKHLTKGSHLSLHIKSTEEKVVKEHQQLASTDEINNSQRTIRENSDGLEEFERDERRMIASKLLERQG